MPVAQFPDSKSDYLTLSSAKLSALLADCNESSGFTVSFYGKSNNNANSRFFDMSTGSAWAGGSTSRYLFFAPNGSLKARYADGNNGETGDVGPITPSDVNSFHTWTVTAKAGALTVYKDGVKVGTTLISTNINVSWFESMVASNLFIGASCWDDSAFSGYMRDLRVYDIALNDSQVAEVATDTYNHRTETENANTQIDCQTLAEAKDIFESRISAMAANGYSSLYKNIAPAYECYKDACAATGEDAALLARFNTALTNMTPFEEYTAEESPSGTDFEPEEGYYSNVIYSEGGTDGEHAFSSDSKVILYDSVASAWKYGTHAYIYYPSTVLLYDGKTTPKVPVLAGFRNEDNRYSLNMLYLSDELLDFSINSWWKGGAGSGKESAKSADYYSFIWPTGSGASYNTIPSDTSNTSENDNAETVRPNDYSSDADKVYRLHKNALSYTATPTNAYTCYSSSSWIMCGQYTYAIPNYQIYGTLTNNDADIVVINYKKLLDGLKSVANNNDYKGYLNELTTNYAEGGLEGLFEALDSGSTLNPGSGSTYFNHTYDYSNTAGADIDEPMDEAALLCGDDIEESVHLLNTITLTTYKSDVKRLRAAVTAYETAMSGMTHVSKNLKAAYDAYLIAIEYLDSYDYGGNITLNFKDAAVALENATIAMTTYSIPTWNGTANYLGNPAVNGGQNILYCSSGSFTQTSGVSYYTNYTYVPDNVVLIDDGKARPYYPTAVYMTHNFGTNWAFTYAIAVNSDISGLTVNWRGYVKNASSYSFVDLNDSNYGHGSAEDRSPAKDYPFSYQIGYKTSEGQYNGYINGTSDKYYYFNRMYLNNNLNYGNTYYKYATSATVNWLGYHDHFRDCRGANEQSANATKSANVYSIYFTPLNTILEDVISDWPSTGINIRNYREGGLEDWFKGIDKITSLNPNNYDYANGESYSGGSRSTLGAVQHCAADIEAILTDEAVDGMATDITDTDNTVSDITVDTKTTGDATADDAEVDIENNAPYTNLKIAILEAEKAPKTQGCIIQSYWEDYGDELDDAKAIMVAIASQGGYSDNTYSDSDLNNQAVALHNAIQALDDYNNYSHPLKFSYQDNGTEGMYFQCNSNNSHIVDHDDDKTVIAADGSAYTALGMVYKTLDKTKYQDFDSIATAKTTYDNVKSNTHATDSLTGNTEHLKVQSIVDDGVSALLTAINSSNTSEGKTYNVTFKTFIDGVESTSVVTNHPYGAVPTLSVDTSLLSSYNVKYWEVADRRINTNAESMKINYQGDVTVEVYLTSPAANINLVINDINGSEFYSLDVTSDSTIAFNSANPNIVVVDGANRIVPHSLTYTITGWTINGQSYTELNTTVGELAGNTATLTLKPTKSSNRPKSQGEGGVETETVYHFTMDGEPVSDGDVPYDYHLRVNADEDMCEQYGGEVAGIVFYNSDNSIFVPVTYSDSYRFYVNRGMDLYTLMYISPEEAATAAENAEEGEETLHSGYYLPAINVGTQEKYKPYEITNKETVFYLRYKMPMVYSYSEPTGTNKGAIGIEGVDGYRSDKWTTRTAFTAEVGGSALYGDVTITECGTLRTLVDEDAFENNFVIENVGKTGYSITQKINSERDAESNQYSYTVSSSADTQRTVYTRAYVKYSYTYQGTKIDAIAYGPICASYYGQGNQA